MLRQVAEGVLVRESEFLQSNAVVVLGRAGALVIDPGVLENELVALAGELRAMDRPIVAGFSTHPHWDHLLWHSSLGDAPRLATTRAAATARARLSDAGAAGRVRSMIPTDIVDRVSLDLLGGITGVGAGTTELPWDGPPIRIVEHDGHAPGHAALVIEDLGVLVAGDMLSDLLVPALDLSGAPDPIGDYLSGLERLERAADGVGVVIPGHGSLAGADALRIRIHRDRAYIEALRDGRAPDDDPRLGPSSQHAWVRGLHERQRDALAARREAAVPGDSG